MYKYIVQYALEANTVLNGAENKLSLLTEEYIPKELRNLASKQFKTW